MANFYEKLHHIWMKLNKSALILSLILAYLLIGVVGYSAFPIPIFRTYTIKGVDSDNVARELTLSKYPDKKSLVVEGINNDVDISISTNYHLQHGVLEGCIAFLLFSLVFHIRPDLMVRLFKIKSDLLEKLRNRSKHGRNVREIE